MPRLLIIGTGLIGGSFALAMRRAGCFERIDGHDADGAVAQRAFARGLIDAVTSDLDAAIEGADAVLIAVPVPQVAPLVKRIAPHAAKRDITAFDAGSVKCGVIDELRRDAPVPRWFVPSHPMAGSERRGPEAADADLFRGRPVIVTPHAGGDPLALERVRNWWIAAGANVIDTTVEIHDEMVALTSHLPHLIAYAFMQWVEQPHGADPRDFAGPGLLDFTRIAASDATMWRQILADNRARVLHEFDGWLDSLVRLRDLLRDGRLDEFEAQLARAQGARMQLADRLRE